MTTASAPFVFESTHRFYWSTENPVPVAKVAESLLALERIIRITPRVLERVTQIEIGETQVYVESIESGSLYEDILIRLIFKDKANFEAFIDKIGEIVRKPGMTRSVLITAVIAAVIGVGAYLTVQKDSTANQTTINANNNVIINLGAGQVDLTPEAFRAIVEAAVTDKKQLAKDAVKVFEPAHGDRKAALIIDESEQARFSPEVIAATPKVLKIDKQEKTEFLHDVDLQIRATDLDSLTRGWAAVIPGKIDRRVKLKLDPGIRPADIADSFSVRADVTVHYKLDNTGRKMVPDYIALHQVIQDE